MLVGDGAVGKTAQMWRITSDLFAEEYDPTIDDWNYHTRTLADGSVVSITFEESGAQEDTYNRDLRFTRAHGIAFFVSITDRRSFESIIAYRDTIVKARKGSPFECILVSTKSDLEDSRVNSDLELEELARALECSHISTSAKNGTNCHEWVAALAESIVPSARPGSKNKLSACVIS